MEDETVISNYRLSAEAKVIKSSPDGSSLVIGGVDGSFTVLIIVDPNRNETRKLLAQLPSRSVNNLTKRSITSWKMAAKLAVIAARRQRDDDLNITKTCAIC